MMMSGNEDALQANIRFLEHELARHKQTTWDEFAKAALTGILANCEMTAPAAYAQSIVKDCCTLADAMMEARKS